MLEYRSLAVGTIPADCGYEARQSPARLWALRYQRSEGVREKVMGKLKMGVMQMVEVARAEIEEVEARSFSAPPEAPQAPAPAPAKAPAPPPA